MASQANKIRVSVLVSYVALAIVLDVFNWQSGQTGMYDFRAAMSIFTWMTCICALFLFSWNSRNAKDRTSILLRGVGCLFVAATTVYLVVLLRSVLA